MGNIRITSVADPFRSRRLAQAAVGVISLAQAMGLLKDLDLDRLDLPAFRSVVDRIADAGIGTEVQAALSAPADRLEAAEMGELVHQLALALEDSAAPRQEMEALEDLFGVETLSGLIGTSPASLRRYRLGERNPPDAVAARLHFLATVVGDLAGAYNDYGIRRWFERPRTLLEGKKPGELLHGDWLPEDLEPQRLRALARSLTASPAT
jgi:hypothetical protein